MDLDVFRWLLTDEGQEALAAATRSQAEGLAPLVAGERLRRTLPGDRAAAVLGQVALRVSARDKLGPDAERMYLTPEALEQCTRHEVASHRAARIAAASPASVADLGCGVGGDLVALARTGALVTGVDLDPLRAAMAEANLAALGLPGTAALADATLLDLAGFGAVFADPARRTGRGRVFDVDSYSPPWAFVEALMARPACAKVAPGVPHDRVPPGAEAEWVSFGGEVKEAAVWSPQLATTARRASVLSRSGPEVAVATLTAEDAPGEVAVGPPGRFLHEPDGAVIRAGLVGAVAARCGGWLLDEHIAYVSSDDPAPSAYARSFEVLEELPHREKQLRAALRARGVGRLTIKKRGVAVVPEVLRARLALRGDAVATVVLTRVQGRGKALLVRPLG